MLYFFISCVVFCSHLTSCCISLYFVLFFPAIRHHAVFLYIFVVFLQPSIFMLFLSIFCVIFSAIHIMLYFFIFCNVFCSHPTSCCSAAEIMSVLFFNTMKYSVKKPLDPANDRFVLSKVRHHRSKFKVIYIHWLCLTSH